MYKRETIVDKYMYLTYYAHLVVIEEVMTARIYGLESLKLLKPVSALKKLFSATLHNHWKP
jgi:hypothetical protein